MSQQQQSKKSFVCFKCQENILLKKNPTTNAWIRLDYDNPENEHTCKPGKLTIKTGAQINKQEQEQRPSQQPSLYEKISAMEKRLE
jgi:hypothetical protein